MDGLAEFDVDVRGPRTLVRFAQFVCIMGAGGFFLAVVASYYGHLWTPFDAFANLRVHLMGAWLGFSLAMISLFMLKKVRLAVVILFLAAITTILYAGFSPRIAQGLPVDLKPGQYEKPFKLVSYNVWARHKTPEKIIDYLNEEDADMVVLIEFTKAYGKLLKLLKKKYPHQHDCNAKPYCHIVILSKTPFAATGSRSNAEWDGPSMVWTRSGDELGGLTLFGVHFARPFTPNRQFTQMRSMASETFIAKGPFVVAGDFNATKHSFLVNAFQEFSGVLRITSLPTWPTWFVELPQIGIDHIFISNGIRPLAHPEVGRNAGSDHLPVKATLAVKHVP